MGVLRGAKNVFLGIHVEQTRLRWHLRCVEMLRACDQVYACESSAHDCILSFSFTLGCSLGDREIALLPLKNGQVCSGRWNAWHPGTPRGGLSHSITTLAFSTPSPALETFNVVARLDDNAHGKLFVDANSKETNVTTVVVHPYSKDEKALDNASICLLGRMPQENGIEISVRTRHLALVVRIAN